MSTSNLSVTDGSSSVYDEADTNDWSDSDSLDSTDEVERFLDGEDNHATVDPSDLASRLDSIITRSTAELLGLDFENLPAKLTGDSESKVNIESEQPLNQEIATEVEVSPHEEVQKEGNAPPAPSTETAQQPQPTSNGGSESKLDVDQRTSSQFYRIPYRSRVIRYKRPPYWVSLFPGDSTKLIYFHGATDDVLPIPAKIVKRLRFRESAKLPDALRSLLRYMDFRVLTDGDSWLCYWGCFYRDSRYRRLLSHQRINHMPLFCRVGNRGFLYSCIQRLGRTYGTDLIDFYPTSYLIPEDLSSLSINFNRYRMWLVRTFRPDPDERAETFHDFEDDFMIIKERSQLPRENVTAIVSRFIMDPFLINQTRFTMQFYVLVRSLFPLRIYLYDDGIAEFATSRFPNRNGPIRTFDRSHLVNLAARPLQSMRPITARSRRGSLASGLSSLRGSTESLSSGHVPPSQVVAEVSEMLGVDEFERVWTLSTLKMHYEDVLKHSWSAVQIQVDQIVTKTLLSAHLQMAKDIRSLLPDPGQCNCCFELLRFDVFIDNEHKVWLSGVRESPPLTNLMDDADEFFEKMVTDIYNLVGVQPVKPQTEKQHLFENGNAPYQMPEEDATKQAIILHNKQYSLCVENITLQEEQILKNFENEQERRGSFQRLYPTENTTELLNVYEPSYEDYFLSQWLTHDRDIRLRFLKEMTNEKSTRSLVKLNSAQMSAENLNVPTFKSGEKRNISFGLDSRRRSSAIGNGHLKMPNFSLSNSGASNEFNDSLANFTRAQQLGLAPSWHSGSAQIIRRRRQSAAGSNSGIILSHSQNITDIMSPSAMMILEERKQSQTSAAALGSSSILSSNPFVTRVKQRQWQSNVEKMVHSIAPTGTSFIESPSENEEDAETEKLHIPKESIARNLSREALGPDSPFKFGHSDEGENENSSALELAGKSANSKYDGMLAKLSVEEDNPQIIIQSLDETKGSLDVVQEISESAFHFTPLPKPPKLQFHSRKVKNGPIPESLRVGLSPTFRRKQAPKASVQLAGLKLPVLDQMPFEKFTKSLHIKALQPAKEKGDETFFDIVKAIPLSKDYNNKKIAKNDINQRRFVDTAIPIKPVKGKELNLKVLSPREMCIQELLYARTRVPPLNDPLLKNPRYGKRDGVGNMDTEEKLIGEVVPPSVDTNSNSLSEIVVNPSDTVQPAIAEEIQLSKTALPSISISHSFSFSSSGTEEGRRSIEITQSNSQTMHSGSTLDLQKHQRRRSSLAVTDMSAVAPPVLNSGRRSSLAISLSGSRASALEMRTSSSLLSAPKASRDALKTTTANVKLSLNSARRGSYLASQVLNNYEESSSESDDPDDRFLVVERVRRPSIVVESASIRVSDTSVNGRKMSLNNVGAPLKKSNENESMNEISFNQSKIISNTVQNTTKADKSQKNEIQILEQANSEIDKTPWSKRKAAALAAEESERLQDVAHAILFRLDESPLRAQLPLDAMEAAAKGDKSLGLEFADATIAERIANGSAKIFGVKHWTQIESIVRAQSYSSWKPSAATQSAGWTRRARRHFGAGAKRNTPMSERDYYSKFSMF